MKSGLFKRIFKKNKINTHFYQCSTCSMHLYRAVEVFPLPFIWIRLCQKGIFRENLLKRREFMRFKQFQFIICAAYCALAGG